MVKNMRNNKKIFLFYFPSIFIVLLALILPIFQLRAGINSEIGLSMVFYVYVPKPLREAYTLNIIGIEDQTKVTIYDISKRPASILKETTINKKEILSYGETKEAYLKIVSNKPVIAVAGASTKDALFAPSGTTFYPSLDGGYVGKRFLFMSISGWLLETSQAVLAGIRRPGPYATIVYAVEDASFIVTDEESGEIIAEATLTANSYLEIFLERKKMYRVESTGKIMIAAWSTGLTALPSVSGSFVGRRFFMMIMYYQIVWYQSTWQNAAGRGAFLIFAYEPGIVKVYDADTNEVLYTHEFKKPGEYWYVYGPNPPPSTAAGAPPPTPYDPNLKPKNIRIESTCDISVYGGDGGGPIEGGGEGSEFWDKEWRGLFGLPSDICFAGGKDGKEFWVFADRYAIIFAGEDDTRLTVEGLKVVQRRAEEVKIERTLRQDEYLVLEWGYYHITSNKPIIVELSTGGGIEYFGNYLVSYPEIPVKSPEIGQQTFPIWIIIVPVAVVALIAVIFLRKRSKASI